MKTITQFVFALLIFIPISLFSQTFDGRSKEQIKYDRAMETHVLGYWKHKMSTDPSGEHFQENTEYVMFDDSTYSCKEIEDGDTIITFGYWYVNDKCINLHEIRNSNVTVLKDILRIEHVSEKVITWTSEYGVVSRRKNSLYQRVIEVE